MTGARGILAFVALASVAACGHKPDAGTAADTTAAAAKDSAAMTTTGAVGPSKVEGFQHPESVKYGVHAPTGSRVETASRSGV